ncbi:MAG: toll/interleukin-1 receptor domain-containing protein [Acidobacteriia bacterium]|nr:toll/interleukin-1 receptor domain-containing protein [Terriglobia bacterium]
MANPEHLAKRKEGVEAWNRWRNKHPEITPDLSQADLSRANLSGANLKLANLSGAYLHRANLTRADLSGAHLAESDLSHSDLFRANLREADLSGSDLSEANLSGANFSNTGFSDAMVEGTIFGDNDLSTAKGLETVHHFGPSIIGIATIYNSEASIPQSFLRGCGVPDDLMIYMKSLAGRTIEFYSCFISYSTKDQAFADRLYTDLQSKGVRCWFAPHDVQSGRKLHEQVDEAIRLHDKLLLILSRHSMESEWVKTEIAKARRREACDKRRILFPIRLVPFEILRDWECFDADTGKDSAREIREYFIPDFSNWKNHDSYQKGFERLLKDLKAQDSAAAT